MESSNLDTRLSRLIGSLVVSLESKTAEVDTLVQRVADQHQLIADLTAQVQHLEELRQLETAK